MHPLIHWLEHTTFFGTGLLFWQAALRHDKRRLLGVLRISTLNRRKYGD